ncbi:MAG: YlmC/YmxH family sporulation protein [Oscillospiraceae bacterium]|jgi:YlmC/YmxH family sporulation protein|nr:YlmC/YmxH family sporulation protein [Oscillospiraceae bacterium]
MGNVSRRFSTLQCKEVINICDGNRLGYVRDLEVDTVNGKIVAIIVPAAGKLFGLFGRNEDYVIPWDHIEQIGDDVILVNTHLDKVTRPRPKKDFF